MIGVAIVNGVFKHEVRFLLLLGVYTLVSCSRCMCWASCCVHRRTTGTRQAWTCSPTPPQRWCTRMSSPASGTKSTFSSTGTTQRTRCAPPRVCSGSLFGVGSLGFVAQVSDGDSPQSQPALIPSQVRINDTTVVLNQTFSGNVVRRIGLYGFDAGTVWFDEVYAGPDNQVSEANGQCRNYLHLRRPVYVTVSCNSAIVITPLLFLRP